MYSCWTAKPLLCGNRGRTYWWMTVCWSVVGSSGCLAASPVSLPAYFPTRPLTPSTKRWWASSTPSLPSSSSSLAVLFAHYIVQWNPSIRTPLKWGNFSTFFPQEKSLFWWKLYSVPLVLGLQGLLRACVFPFSIALYSATATWYNHKTNRFWNKLINYCVASVYIGGSERK